MDRLKRYLPSSAMKLMNDSLILSHLLFGITNWGFEWERISKLQKRALRIMTNSRYNAHTEPLFKKLNLLKVKDIFDVQCLKFWYKFVNNKLHVPIYFRDMYKFNHELHDIETRNHDRLHLYPTRTSGARNVLRHHIPELLNIFPQYIINKIKTHSIYSFSHQIKSTWLIMHVTISIAMLNRPQAVICGSGKSRWDFKSFMAESLRHQLVQFSDGPPNGPHIFLPCLSFYLRL